jgi:hypothetical protein
MKLKPDENLGHTDPATTDRYLSNDHAFTPEEMRRLGGLGEEACSPQNSPRVVNPIVNCRSSPAVSVCGIQV